MNHVTSEYLRRCGTDERLRSILPTTPLPALLRHSYENRFTARPFFADRAAMDAVGLDVKNLLDIIVSLPQRLFGDDLGKYCAAIGVDEKRAELITRLRSDEVPRSGRADLYRVGEDFKLLEFNVVSGLGSADMIEMGHALMAVPAFAEFAQEYRLELTDPVAAKAEVLRAAAARVCGNEEPVIAAIESDGVFETWLQQFQSVQRLLPRHGLHLHMGELGQLQLKSGRVHLDGRPVDLVLRYFSVDQIADDPSGRAAYEMLCRAHEQGRLVLHTPLENELFNNKATLALLSDPRYRQEFSGPEQELIDRLLPWTRLLRADQLSFAVTHRSDLILKPGAGLQGIGVVAGWETGPEEWEKLLRDNVDGSVIIQQRVDPTPEALVDPGSGRLELVRAVWGVFFSPEGYSGTAIRALPADGGAVINHGGGRNSSITTLFTYT